MSRKFSDSDIGGEEAAARISDDVEVGAPNGVPTKDLFGKSEGKSKVYVCPRGHVNPPLCSRGSNCVLSTNGRGVCLICKKGRDGICDACDTT